MGLQDLAARIESGEMHRDDVLWRLQSYFHAVGVVLDECGGSGEPSEPVRQAVSVLQLFKVRCKTSCWRLQSASALWIRILSDTPCCPRASNHLPSLPVSSRFQLGRSLIRTRVGSSSIAGSSSSFLIGPLRLSLPTRAQLLRCLILSGTLPRRAFGSCRL